jgi:hypothetical protein
MKRSRASVRYRANGFEMTPYDKLKDIRKARDTRVQADLVSAPGQFVAKEVRLHFWRSITGQLPLRTQAGIRPRASDSATGGI